MTDNISLIIWIRFHNFRQMTHCILSLSIFLKYWRLYHTWGVPETSSNNFYFRADSRFAPRQWEMSCAPQSRDVVSKQRRLSLAGRKPRISLVFYNTLAFLQCNLHIPLACAQHKLKTMRIWWTFIYKGAGRLWILYSIQCSVIIK